ncbi:MAG: GFA family protein [Rudaea sp.]|uniref:GFA family protein n=1 Tax=Rudaea sp. TaxID=2136325 RepID=UPI0039E5804E
MTCEITGGCRCGAVRYTSSAAPLDAKICHCRDCQYASGSAFSTVVFFPKAALTVQGETRGYTVKGSAGLSVARHFCPDCGNPLWTQIDELPDVVLIKIGSLDQPGAVQPSGHIWCDSMVPWLKLDDGLERLPGNPPL